MKSATLGLIAFLLVPSAALAASASVGPLACWTPLDGIEMVGCESQSTPDGGAVGHCTIITTTAEGKRAVTKVDGNVKPWGGIHPIHKPETSLKFRYEKGRLTCSFTPSGEYRVGDCVFGPASGSCTVLKTTNGSNRYFKATATARPD
jgi:hypothetical protein